MSRVRAYAYRFSVEWSRVEPTDGIQDEAAWARYVELLRFLEQAGITPMVTLLHFTLPQWIADRGGVTAPDFAERFGRFAGEAARRLGPRVELWCVMNEPNVQMYLGYVLGIWPPGQRSPQEAVKAFAGLMRGHGSAARAIREADPGARLGVAMNLVDFEPESRWSLPDWLVARGCALAFNWAFYDGIRSGRITENGIPDATGDKRGKYIRSHVHAIERALGEGIPVRGYFHWSLVDNFEWADGFAPRFGLYRVDAATLDRAPAGGAETFSALAPK